MINVNAPKVLLYDVESSPNLAWVWGKYEQDVLGDFVKERQIISVAWKWLGDKDVKFVSTKTVKNKELGQFGLIATLYELMSQADIVVGHNVREFDDKFVNTEFVKMGLKPPPPHKQIDTLLVARNKFRFNSNKLGDLAKALGIKTKLETGGFKLWEGFMRGDKKSIKLMEAYNKRDVEVLEQIYLRFRPWIDKHPTMNADNMVACPSCAGTVIQFRGTQISASGRTKRFQCKGCGKWGSAKTVKGKLVLKQ